ncbi:MAG: hypothetical protein AB9836_04510 [Aminipila sp.]
MKHFEIGLMNTENDNRVVCGGILVDPEKSNAEIEGYQGILVTPVKLAPSKAYPGINNKNMYYMKKATATDKEVYVMAPDIPNKVQAPYGTYNMGAQTAGIPIPAGTPVRCVLLQKFSTGTWASGNFAAEVGTKKFATITNGDLTPADAAPTSGIYVEILEPTSFTIANRGGGNGYYCKVKEA